MGFIFNPEVLHDIARRHVGMPHAEMAAGIIAELAQTYPGHIETRQNWIFSLAGGAVGVMTILHGSLSEYVILFGTPIGTTGFSGRYLMDVYDFMLSGEMWTYTEDHFHDRIVTLPGDYVVLKWGRVKGFRLPDAAWMLEYGRGVIPASLPFALSDALISCLDFPTIGKTMWLYGKLVCKELLLRGKV
jgi:C-8 sterol isomerase